MIQLPRPHAAAFHLGRVAVWTLAFAIAQLIGEVRSGRLVADCREDDCDFGHDLESAEIVRVAEAELRGALIRITERDSQARRFDHFRKGGRTEWCQVLPYHGEKGVSFIHPPINPPVGEPN